MDKVYACIDLKSFFASVESVERGLDPLKDRLVVADESRGLGAITLAVTPALKDLGVKNRCRLFEIPKNLDYIIARPRMKLYMKYSAEIYGIYLKYISPEDIHIYSVDECFIDLTGYISMYNKSPKEIMKMIMDDVYREKGILATSGIGTNLFLAKVALDITAKHSKDYIGYLDKESFDRTVLKHRPITDIWGIGKGTARTLEKYDIFDLEGVRNSNEKLMYKLFGVNAELLIDHANGYEPCTISEIHAYLPENHGVSSSQILFENYNFTDAWIVLMEMIENLTLEITEYDLKSEVISLTVGYANKSIKSTGGSRKLKMATNSFQELTYAFKLLYDSTVRKEFLIRKLSISLNGLKKTNSVQIDLFGKNKVNEKELKVQKAMIDIKKKFGKNSILRGTSLYKKATMIERNTLVGGHYGGEKDEYK